GLLHDIGKIGISENLLNKPGELTGKEYEEICKHSEIGYRIVKASENMKEISESILSHHEKWDGSGYPRGIKGEEIPIASRIIAITDTYDAMTSDRSYRLAMPKTDAIEELIRCKGTQFEPGLVDVFVNEVLSKEDV
ncbi:MAG: HD-GYP domain-containing protein, partial [Anaerotignum sp.]